MIKRVIQTIQRHELIAPRDRIVVGVSGGVDSLVLLHVLNHLRSMWNFEIHAATLDHSIRGTASAEDAAYVQQIAHDWQIPVTATRIDVPAIAQERKLGLEDAARQARYDFLAQVAQKINASKIAVGHNQDDQAETILLHLIRGSGLSGLGGMRHSTSIRASRMSIIRPLLDTPRAMIEAYARDHELTPRQDATNADITYTRNRLRHEIIPLLETLNPNLRETLARTADILRADAELIEQVGSAALTRVIRDSGASWIRLARPVWESLSLSEKRTVIRAIVERLRPDVRNLTLIQVDSAIQILDQGRTGAIAQLPGDLRLHVSYNSLIAGAKPEMDAPVWIPGPAFSPTEAVTRSGSGWIFTCRPLIASDDPDQIRQNPLAALLAVPPDARLDLRARQPGDRFQPHGMGGRSQKLSDTLINAHIPAQWRDKIPLLTVNDQIAWFVFPTDEGPRSRIAEPFSKDHGLRIVSCWQKE